jgi:hypothetical protein
MWGPLRLHGNLDESMTTAVPLGSDSGAFVAHAGRSNPQNGERPWLLTPNKPLGKEYAHE